MVSNNPRLFPGEVKDDMVFCSDLLDALTQEFFSRDGNAIEEPLHVEDIKVSGLPCLSCYSELDIFQVQAFSDRPGYERTSSSLWKQREEHCASLIQQAWRDHYKSVI